MLHPLIGISGSAPGCHPRGPAPTTTASRGPRRPSASRAASHLPRRPPARSARARAGRRLLRLLLAGAHEHERAPAAALRPQRRRPAGPSCAGRASRRAPSRRARSAAGRELGETLSSRSVRASGGSIGTSALRSSLSTSFTHRVSFIRLLELLDRPVDQHLGGALGAAERSGDLAVVHVEREPHDQRLAAVVGQVRHAREHLLHLLAPLHEGPRWGAVAVRSAASSSLVCGRRERSR